jgi:hypothetical protein
MQYSLRDRVGPGAGALPRTDKVGPQTYQSLHRDSPTDNLTRPHIVQHFKFTENSFLGYLRFAKKMLSYLAMDGWASEQERARASERLVRRFC